MNITKIGTTPDLAAHKMKQCKHTPAIGHTASQTSYTDIFYRMEPTEKERIQTEKNKDFNTAKEHNRKQTKLPPSESEKTDDTKTDTDIIVKPDGSRVLVVTMDMGGMKTAMSLLISKPTLIPNAADMSGELKEDTRNETVQNFTPDIESY